MSGSSEENDSEKVTWKIFAATMIGAALFAGIVFLFIL